MNENAHRSNETTEENKDVSIIVSTVYHKTTYMTHIFASLPDKGQRKGKIR